MFMLEWKKIDRERGKVMQISRKYQLIAPVIVWVLGMIQIIRYIMLGNMAALLTVVLLEVWFGVISYAAYRGKFPALLIMVGIGAVVCYVFTNHVETTLFNVIYIFQAAAALLGGILGTAIMLRKKERPDKKMDLTCGGSACDGSGISGSVGCSVFPCAQHGGRER